MKGAWLGHVNHPQLKQESSTDTERRAGLSAIAELHVYYSISLERLIVSGAVNLGGRSVWETGDGLGHQFITLTIDICVYTTRWA